MKFRTPYSKPLSVKSMPVGASRTKQHFLDEVNVNNIVKRYRKTKDKALLDVRDAFFADFSEQLDLAQAYSAIDKAEFEFGKLPATARQFFDNDPVRFFREMSDPERVKSLPDTLGLLNPRKAVPEPSGAPAPSEPKGEPPAAAPTE